MNSIFANISSRENISNSLFAKFSSRENKVLYSISILKKMAQCALLSQSQVELIRLCNQLPVLGKANSLCEVGNISCHLSFVKMVCFACLRVASSVYRLDDVLHYQLRPWRWGKHTNSRFLRFFVRSVPLFRSLMLTSMCPVLSEVFCIVLHCIQTNIRARLTKTVQF